MRPWRCRMRRQQPMLVVWVVAVWGMCGRLLRSESRNYWNCPRAFFVVCGLAVGVPRELPDMKPKQPRGAVVHKNKYASEAALLEELSAYDKDISQYNRTRSGTTSENDWCGHIINYYEEAMSYRILDYLRKQGFDPKK